MGSMSVNLSIVICYAAVLGLSTQQLADDDSFPRRGSERPPEERRLLVDEKRVFASGGWLPHLSMWWAQWLSEPLPIN